MALSGKDKAVACALVAGTDCLVKLLECPPGTKAGAAADMEKRRAGGVLGPAFKDFSRPAKGF